MTTYWDVYGYASEAAFDNRERQEVELGLPRRRDAERAAKKALKDYPIVKAVRQPDYETRVYRREAAPVAQPIPRRRPGGR